MVILYPVWGLYLLYVLLRSDFISSLQLHTNMAERARKRAKHGDALNGANGANGPLADYTASESLLDALVDADVTHLFVNLGSDHPALLEAMSKRKKEGKEKLNIVTAPNEFVGLCACQGFFQASGKMQAILIHVDAGTLAMAGAIHNVARARIPVVMIAGTSPVTEENEMTGSRNVRSLIDYRSTHLTYDFAYRSSSITCRIPLISEEL